MMTFSGYLATFILGTIFGMALCAIMVANQQAKWKERVIRSLRPKTGAHRDRP